MRTMQATQIFRCPSVWVYSRSWSQARIRDTRRVGEPSFHLCSLGPDRSTSPSYGWRAGNVLCGKSDSVVGPQCTGGLRRIWTPVGAHPDHFRPHTESMDRPSRRGASASTGAFHKRTHLSVPIPFVDEVRCPTTTASDLASVGRRWHTHRRDRTTRQRSVSSLQIRTSSGMNLGALWT